jgi:hypothetical protein
VKKETFNALRSSKYFLSWAPTPAPTAKIERAGSGRGKTFTYVGKKYTNLVTEERHYTVPEISKLWSVSVDLVRDTFADEPGVLKWHRPATKAKRAYSLLRVPESVLTRVHRRLTERG